MRILDRVKILDLSRSLAASLATMYLARFGAEVVKVEHPDGGDPAGGWEPDRKGQPLLFAYLHGGKKSVTLDLDGKPGQDALKRILPEYDVLCEDWGPGGLEAIGLGGQEIRKHNPDIIQASFSIFGHSGPYADRPGNGLIGQCKAVAMDMTGAEGGYPLKNEPAVGEHFGAAYLASGIVMALTQRRQGDKGQKVDIALTDALFSSVEAAPAAYSALGEIHTRRGNFDPSCAPYDSFATRDGFVAIGCATETQWQKFCEAFAAGDLLRDPRFRDNEGRRTDYPRVLRPLLAERLLPMAKAEVEAACRRAGVPCSVVLGVGEAARHPQIVANGLLEELPGRPPFVAPALAFRLSAAPARAAEAGAAPGRGEHNAEVLGTAGSPWPDLPRSAGRHPLPGAEGGNMFSGVRVLDFTHAYAGPFCTQMLADFGAEVIKIERITGDQARGWGPFKNGYSGYYASFNRGKKSLTLDFSTPEGREIVYQLVRDTPIVCSNFKAGTLDRYGFGYERLKAIRPDLIYAAISGFGDKGDLAATGAYDNVVQAMSGIMALNGFPGGDPTKIGPAIGDNYTGLLLFTGICLAWYHLLAIGKGQKVDVSMLGALFCMAEQAVIDYANNGVERPPTGNCGLGHAPDDVYRVKDGFLGLSIRNDVEWNHFCARFERADLGADARFAHNADRLRNRTDLGRELERLFRAWTRRAIEERLEGTGITAGGVIGIAEALDDPHFAAREMVITVDDPVMGPLRLVGNPIKLSGARPILHRPSPTLGRDTDEILRSLGYSAQEIASLRNKGVIAPDRAGSGA